MKRKPIAYAVHLLRRLSELDEEAQKRVRWSCDQTRWFGVLYIAEGTPVLKDIESLGYRLPFDGKYYVLRRERR